MAQASRVEPHHYNDGTHRGTMKTLASCITAFSFTIVLATLTPQARAVPGDEHWDCAFGWPGTSNYVYSITEHNGVIYCSGQSPNGATNAVLYSWDGAQWNQVASFTASGNLTVYDLAFVGETLYAVGNFTGVSGVAVQGLARRDGNTWRAVSGFSGYAYTLAVQGTNLYVGGRYTVSGSVNLTNIGIWDGSAWHELGDGLGVSGDTIGAIAITNGLIYAGGLFTNSNPAITNLAIWNGSNWGPVGPTVGGQIFALTFFGGKLHVGGSFTSIGSTPVNYLASWDGASWSPLAGGLGGGAGVILPTVRSLAVFGGRLCVGGWFATAGGFGCTNFAVWDGVAWQTPGTYLSGTSSSGAVCRLRAIGNTLYLGGFFYSVNGVFLYQIGAWDGVNFLPVGNPRRANGPNSFVKAVASDGTYLYAGGTFSRVGQVAANRIARWDGTNWSALGSGMNGDVNALAIVGTDVYAGGTFTSAGGTPATHIARWDGYNWYALGGGISGTVSALAAYGNNLLVGGNFQFWDPNNELATAIGLWDGANWWHFGGWTFMTLITGIGVDAIAVQGNDVYLGGNFSASNMSGQRSDNIVRFDGNDWQPLGTGVNTNVYAIAVVGSTVYAGGNFTNASGVPVSRIAKWDGATWSSVGGGVFGAGNFSVGALATVGTDLYAAGSFTNAGGSLVVGRVAKWDGSTWSALGSGVTFPGLSSAAIYTATTSGSDVYLGGAFTATGTKSSFYLAHWNTTTNFDMGPTLQLTKLLRAGNLFKAGINATNVSSYVIEASTDLSSWVPLDTNTAAYYEFWDVNAGSYPRRFYRARTGR